jgi:hypothetical protein
MTESQQATQNQMPVSITPSGFFGDSASNIVGLEIL